MFYETWNATEQLFEVCITGTIQACRLPQVEPTVWKEVARFSHAVVMEAPCLRIISVLQVLGGVTHSGQRFWMKKTSSDGIWNQVLQFSFEVYFGSSDIPQQKMHTRSFSNHFLSFASRCSYTVSPVLDASPNYSPDLGKSHEPFWISYEKHLRKLKTGT